MNWLLTGDGSMFVENGDNDSLSIERKYDETILIPMTNLKLSASNGIDWEDGIFTGELLPVLKSS